MKCHYYGRSWNRNLHKKLYVHRYNYTRIIHFWTVPLDERTKTKIGPSIDTADEGRRKLVITSNLTNKYNMALPFDGCVN